MIRTASTLNLKDRTQTVDGDVSLTLDGSSTVSFSATFVQDSGTIEVTPNPEP